LAEVWRRFTRNRLATAGAAGVLILLTLAVFAPWVAPRDPLYIDMDHKFARPGLAGFVLGALAGYYGGALDAVIMRLVDVLLSMPTIFLLLALAAFLKPTMWTITLIIGLNSWMSVARMVRGQVLSLKEQEFVLAARAAGAGAGRLIVRQLMPNAVAPVLVAATLTVATAILLESSLSYLGYGIQPPTASWGNMLNNAQSYVLYAPWVAVYPGAMISLTVLSFNFAGDGLRDALDPRLARRM